MKQTTTKNPEVAGIPTTQIWRTAHEGYPTKRKATTRDNGVPQPHQTATIERDGCSSKRRDDALILAEQHKRIAPVID